VFVYVRPLNGAQWATKHEFEVLGFGSAEPLRTGSRIHLKGRYGVHPKDVIEIRILMTAYMFSLASCILICYFTLL
jgi:hypothetical protein